MEVKFLFQGSSIILARQNKSINIVNYMKLQLKLPNQLPVHNLFCYLSNFIKITKLQMLKNEVSNFAEIF